MRLTGASLRPRSAAAALLAAVLGCGPTVSLDDPDPAGSSGTSTGGGPFGVLSASTDEGATLGVLDDGPRLDLSDAKLDVAPEIPLPPGSCMPDCQHTLDRVWAYDGFADGAPLDPEDHVAVIAEPDGGFTVAEERQGQLRLARLSEHGQEQWTMPLGLPCDPCRLVELAIHPSGDLLIAGHGLDATRSPVALAARVELGGPQLVWATSTPLATGTGITPRAGSLIVYDADLLHQPVLAASTTAGIERLELLAYDGATGGLVSTELVATDLASGSAPAPRAAYDAAGALVVAHPRWDLGATLSGRVSWLAGVDGEVLAIGPRVEPSLRMAVDFDRRVLTLGQTPGARQSLLYLDSGQQRDPEQWQLVYVLPTVTSRTPALAVDGYGHAHVVARTAAGRPGLEGSTALEVLRWSDDGNLVWKLSLPLALDPVDEPVSLALAFFGDLVIGGFVAGARHVELRRHGCDCG